MLKKLFVLLHIVSTCCAMTVVRPLISSVSLVQKFAAGVLPVAVGSQETAVFLIGKEYVAKEDREVWGAFAGNGKKGELTVYAAAREFSEETRGMFASKKSKTPVEDTARKLSFLSSEKIKALPGGFHQFWMAVNYVETTRFFEMPEGEDGEKSDYAWIDLQPTYLEYIKTKKIDIPGYPLRESFKGTMKCLFDGKANWNVQEIIHEATLRHFCKRDCGIDDYDELPMWVKFSLCKMFESSIAAYEGLGLLVKFKKIVEYEDIMRNPAITNALKMRLIRNYNRYLKKLAEE